MPAGDDRPSGTPGDQDDREMGDERYHMGMSLEAGASGLAEQATVTPRPE